MSTTNRNKSVLKRELERLVIHANDSVKGYEKAADCVSDQSPELNAFFLNHAAVRADYAEKLNERLELIGEESKERGSAEGSMHRGLISVKDMFTSNENPEAIIKEAIRGEEKLIDYIQDTFDDAEIMDEATAKAILDLRADVQTSLEELRRKEA